MQAHLMYGVQRKYTLALALSRSHTRAHAALSVVYLTATSSLPFAFPLSLSLAPIPTRTSQETPPSLTYIRAPPLAIAYIPSHPALPCLPYPVLRCTTCSQAY
ncbi:hypothetical protein K431DRAFT_283366 [Polychaeton citri CBS 116435]|uniref:Uncharacterized protein n=1 Tax=Polychaeton citri CBS 116435 TaxID=1314669 RepID=A0A9P4QCI9_9PEZI|nr:hypothetical protein K431DRAFT_283366 [Polychaeton citri CBS 116435]